MMTITLSRRDRDEPPEGDPSTRYDWEPEGTANWRDVGGLRTSGGHAVRHGRLFRSDTLQDLTARDVDVITGRLGIRTVVDLRLRGESLAEGYGPLAQRPVHHYNLPLVGSWDHDPGGPLPVDADRWIVGYSMSILERSPAAITTAVGLLAEESGTPAVVHCAAGKDRTGVLIALVLSLLGVPDDAIAVEYARSSPRIPAVLRRLSAMPTYAADPDGLLPHLNRTRPQSMLAFLALVRDRYGSVESYLLGQGMAAGVPDALRAALLSDVPMERRRSS